MVQEQSAKVQREPSSDPVRKSRRLAKKSVLDNEIDEDYDTSNIGTPEDWDGNAPELKNKGGSSSKKNASKKIKIKSKAYEVGNEFVTSRSSRDGKKRSRESADDDNTEEEPTSDSELDAEDEQKTATESPVNVRSEPLTTRRRALQSWMDGSSSSTVEFPDGLPLAPSRSRYYPLLSCCPW
jgi:INO80 complex subunit B